MIRNKAEIAATLIMTVMLGWMVAISCISVELDRSPAVSGHINGGNMSKVYLIKPKSGQGKSRLVEAAGPASARDHVANSYFDVTEVKGRELLDLGKTMDLETAGEEAPAPAPDPPPPPETEPEPEPEAGKAGKNK